MKLAELDKITLSYVRVLRHCFLTFLYFISLKISSSKITHLVAHTQNNNVNISDPYRYPVSQTEARLNLHQIPFPNITSVCICVLCGE